MTSPNGAGDRDPAGVFARVRRDKQIANLLYGLLGFEDERDPEASLTSVHHSARMTLDVCGADYRARVLRATHLLQALVLEAAEHANVAVKAFATLTPEQQRLAHELATARRAQYAGGAITVEGVTIGPPTQGTATPAIPIRYGGVDEEPAPCPTCGHVEGIDLDHAHTCPERD